MGVVATRDIKARELILKETPLIVWDDAKSKAGLEAFVNALPDLKKSAYYSHFAAAPYKNLPHAVAIFMTNSLPLSGGIRGIFDTGCRLNHLCRPNCCSQFDDEQGVRWFIANRDIGMGEEICISYTELKEVKVQRMGTLFASFGFRCTCEVCTQPPQSALASDRRRLEYKHIYDSTDRLQYRPLELIKAVNEGLRRAKEEGIVAGTSDLAYQAMTACVWFGDRPNAIRWIDKALELEGHVAGVWSTRCKDIKAWKGDPTRHLGWMDVCRKLRLSPLVLIGPDQD